MKILRRCGKVDDFSLKLIKSLKVLWASIFVCLMMRKSIGEN